MSVSLHSFRKEEESPEKVSLSYHETTSYSEDVEETVSVPFVGIGIVIAIIALIIIAIIIISVLRFIRGDWRVPRSRYFARNNRVYRPELKIEF